MRLNNSKHAYPEEGKGIKIYVPRYS